MSIKTKKNRPSKSFAHIVLYFYMILVLLVMLTVASYTWLAISRTPRVSDLSLYINSPKGMELAVSPDGEWSKRLSYADMVPETAPLRPATWSNTDQCFYGAVYGIDGRLTGRWTPLTDERNANRDHYEGYYCIATFYARSDDSVEVSLTPAIAVEEGGTTGAGTFVIGTPIWNPDTLTHENGGKGAELAVRVGIMVHRLDEQYLPTDDPPLFYIYEPNSDVHVEEPAGYINTPGLDGAETLIPRDHILTQTSTTWTDAEPTQRGIQIFSFGEFSEDMTLFTLDEGETVCIQLYIWLEGQDADCINAIEDAQITANVQFLAQSTNQSGLVDAETEAPEE